MWNIDFKYLKTIALLNIICHIMENVSNSVVAAIGVYL